MMKPSVVHHFMSLTIIPDRINLCYIHLHLVDSLVINVGKYILYVDPMVMSFHVFEPPKTPGNLTLGHLAGYTEPCTAAALRIMGSQNWWFGDPRALLYRVKPLKRRVQ